MPHLVSSSSFTSWGKQGTQTYYYRYGGKTTCNFLQPLPAAVIHHVLRGMYYDFPSRKCRWMSVGDACPSDAHCACEGHPGGSHSGGYALDFDYYTMSESNITQYAQPGTSRTKLWNSDGTLKTNVFDWERVYAFITRMSKAFPNVKFMMDVRIYVHIYQQVEARLGSAAKREFQHYTQGDAEGLYNHDTHMHCQGLEVVDLNALTDDWITWREAA